MIKNIEKRYKIYWILENKKERKIIIIILAETVSAAKKNITASGVRIENGVFVDDEGSIVDRIAEKLPEGTTIFDIKISIEISDEESEPAK